MACCGQQRAALIQGKPTGAQPSSASQASVRLRYTQSSAVLVRGPVTGKHYQFNGTATTLPVDARDAAALIRSGYFRAA